MNRIITNIVYNNIPTAQSTSEKILTYKPQLVSGTKEPSIEEIIFKHYRNYLSEDQAKYWTDKYLNRIKSKFL